MKAMSTDLGRKIQYLRLQSKESQEVMAQKLNISRQAISKWENNVSVPDVAMLSKIANYYDVEITYFTNDENSNDSSKKKMKSLFFLDTQLYRFVLGFVSVLTLMFFSVFSLLLTNTNDFLRHERNIKLYPLKSTFYYCS